jgi:hypothetical protein
LPEYFSILQGSDCRKVGASGGSEMKTITIRLPDVEAAMLAELQKRNAELRDIRQFLVSHIRKEFRLKITPRD